MSRTTLALSVVLAGLVAVLGLIAPASAQFRGEKERFFPPQGYPTPSQPSSSSSLGDLDPVTADEMVVKAAGVGVDGASLAEFLRRRGKADATAQQVQAAVDKLAAKTPAEREKACAEIVAIGPAAIPLLRMAVKDPDGGETVSLARRCLRAIEADSPAISAAAARLLAVRRPEGAADALMSFLPGAEDETVFEEVKTALTTVAYKDGKADPALVKALEDEISLRRALAIEVLCQNGTAEPRAALQKLLRDPTPAVRLRAALALAQVRDAKAVSTLIAVLAELPAPQGRQAEDFLIGLAAEQSPKVALGNDDVSRGKCRDAWAAWWLASEEKPEALLEDVKKRTLDEDNREKVAKLIADLGNDEFEAREKATEELRKMGTAVVSVLRQATTSSDEEVKKRANKLLTDMEKEKITTLSPVTTRLIALRKPAGAAEVLLKYMPFADDEGLAGEVQSALNAVAIRDGKVEPAVLKALEDKSPARRAAAVETLAVVAQSENLATLRKLLKDTDPTVRLKAALIVAGAREKEAVPVLISLINDLPSDQGSLAEDYLRRVAGDKVPKELPAGDDGRKKRSETWAAWWKENETKVALVDRNPPTALTRYFGYTLLISMQTNQVMEYGTDNKQRWVLNGLNGPMGAFALPGDRVLVAEYNAQRVTERNLRGDIVWEKKIPEYPMDVSRSPNGHTFVVTRTKLFEFDRTGREVWKLDRPNGDVMTARKFKDGSVILISNQSMVVKLDSSGKEVKTFRVNEGIGTNANAILPNGNVIIPLSWMNKVTEYDMDGKAVWNATVNQPMSAHRLPNGNTLISTQQWPAKVVEIDKSGKQVNELTAQNYIYNATKR